MAQQLRVVGGDLHVADGRALAQGVVQLLHDDLFAQLVGRGLAAAAGVVQPLQPLVHQREVGQGQLQVHGLDVARRVGGKALLAREGAHHVEQGVHIAQRG